MKKIKTQYSIGDSVWYLPNFEIAILCIITDIDEQGDSIFYWVDEPVGHPIHEEELIESFEEAKKLLKEIYDDYSENLSVKKRKRKSHLSLSDYRRVKINSISSTHHGNGKEKAKNEMKSSLNNKKQGVGWINPDNL